MLVCTVHVEYSVTSFAGLVDVVVHKLATKHFPVVLLLVHILFHIRQGHVVGQRIVSEIHKPAKNSVTNLVVSERLRLVINKI